MKDIHALAIPSFSARRFMMPAFAAYLGFSFTLSSLTASAQDGADPFKGSASATAKKEKENPNPSPPPSTFSQICVTVEWLEMESKDALELMRKGLAPNSPELISAIRQKETDGKATALDAISVVSRSGQRSLMEGVKENIYPTEFTEPGGKSLSQLDVSGTQLKSDKFAFVLEPPTTAQPKAFEMRPSGTRVEVDAVVGPDGKMIDLNLSPEMVRYVGTTEHGLASMGGKLVPLIQQPVFISNKLTTAITLTSGQTIVAGMSTPIKDDGSPDATKKVLTLVHAVVFFEETK